MQWWQVLFAGLFGLQLAAVVGVWMAGGVVWVGARLRTMLDTADDLQPVVGWHTQAGAQASGEMMARAVRPDSDGGSTNQPSPLGR